MQKKLNIAVINYNIKVGRGFGRFKQRITDIVKRMASRKVDLIAFPEYLGFDMTTPTALSSILGDISSYYDNYITLFRGLAAKYKIYILAGTTVEPIKRHYYNTLHLYGPDGEIIKYRKVHLHKLDIELGFKDGNTPLMTNIGGIPIGLLICYDLGFPELARIYGLEGSLGILAPSLAPGYGAYMWLRYCGHARAIENQGFLVLASGTLEGLPGPKTYGKPAILVTTDYKSDGVISEDDNIAIGTIDIDRLLKIREITAAPVLTQIKPALYFKINKLIGKRFIKETG